MGFLNRLPARQDGYYTRNRMWKNKGSDTTTNRRTLVSPSHMLVNIGGAGKHAYELEEAVELDLNVAASWDTTTPTDYTNAANRAGKDFYIYVCEPESGFSPKIVLSAATTWPAGYTAENSRKIGGFHCLPGDCINLPSGHPYKDYIQGDILFNSIWDLIDRPRSPPEGMVKISLTPSDGKPALWCDIYLASGTGTTCTSVFGATIQDGKDWNTFVEYGRLQNKRLMRDAEFQNAAFGSNEETNIAGSSDPGTVTFPLDTAGRSMIGYYGTIGMCGIMWQWLDEQSYRFDPDGAQVVANQTATITYVESLEGVPIYLKWNGPVPYLCANITADLWIAVGNHKIQIKADATPATGGTQIYFDDDATQPYRLLSAVTNGKDAMIPSSHPDFSLIIKYNADPVTPGVELRYDNVTHNRLEAINAHGVNAGIDLSLSSPVWGYYDLPASKGSLYRQGAYGDVKLHAGGYWTYGAAAGSRCRAAATSRWSAYSSIGGRFAAEPV